MARPVLARLARSIGGELCPAIALAVALTLATPPAAGVAQDPPAGRDSARLAPEPADGGGQAARPRLLVTGMSASTIYLSLEDPGPTQLSAGSLLELAATDDGPTIGRLRLLEAAGTRLLARFEADPFLVTRGTVLYLSAIDGAAVAAVRDGPVVGPRRGRTGRPLAAAGDAGPARGRPVSTTTDRVMGPHLSGLLSLESDLRRSSSHFTGDRDGTISRTFATPGARIRATLSGLPAGLRIHTSLTAYGRERVSRRPLQESQVQLFEAYAAASPRGSPLLLQGGRFLNRYEAFTGYWDGGLLRVGSRRFGVGAAAGWEPPVRHEVLDRGLLKYGAFLGLDSEPGSVRYRITLSASRLEPRAGGVDSEPGALDTGPRTSIGASGGLTAGAVGLHASLEAERDTAAAGWGLSRANLNATVRAGPLTVRANASRLRGPVGVTFDPSLDPRRGNPRLGPARDRVGGGASLRVGSGTVGGDVTLSRDRLERLSRTYAAHLSLPRALPARLALRMSGFYWEGERTNAAASGFAALSRRFGKVRAELGYRIDRSERSGLAVLSHGLQIGFSVRGSTGWNYDMNAFARRGPDLETDRLYTRLSRSF